MRSTKLSAINAARLAASAPPAAILPSTRATIAQCRQSSASASARADTLPVTITLAFVRTLGAQGVHQPQPHHWCLPSWRPLTVASPAPACGKEPEMLSSQHKQLRTPAEFELGTMIGRVPPVTDTIGDPPLP